MARKKKSKVNRAEGRGEASAVELRRRQGIAAADEDVGIPDAEVRQAAEEGISTDRDVNEQRITRISTGRRQASANRKRTKRARSTTKT